MRGAWPIPAPDRPIQRDGRVQYVNNLLGRRQPSATIPINQVGKLGIHGGVGLPCERTGAHTHHPSC